MITLSVLFLAWVFIKAIPILLILGLAWWVFSKFIN
jgi:hypothetical protein